ncbi:hypothetical protein Q31b_30530 [Novipirellula aureliae]|uniref:Outer membrane protein assembly factor BamD n=1 Tax=Novipirellula aureliae TaxID=2527966 RepID=A0A5C6DYD3_9BACT|nr:hypothetical protein [Novipirellula aureliae]TWU41602.1 hypothetical protein Q31b_30530 [Novipirellula aureliae]
MIRYHQAALRRIMPNCFLCSTLVSLVILSGCQSFGGKKNDLGALTAAPPNADEGASPIQQVSYVDAARESTKKVINFVALREQEDLAKGKELYQAADKKFREAKELSGDEAKKAFYAASKLFRRASEAAPETALQQDAMFMRAESEFFADRLNDAAETYGTLQKTFPRNRHNDLVTARLFTISKYWIETVKAEEGSWNFVNLTDHKRPLTDADGHAIRLLDQIRYDDPTGKLADDATMAAAAEQIRQKKYSKADEFLTDLRETYTDSDHLFLAHLLGIRCKLEIYAGPKYSGLILEEADKLVKQTRERFPDKMQDEKYAEILARAAAEIDFHQSERIAYRAEFREKKQEYGAARYYYNQLLEKHQGSPHAEVARERLAKIEALPDVPVRRLSWLKTVFPDSTASSPLEPTFDADGNRNPSGGETLLR